MKTLLTIGMLSGVFAIPPIWQSQDGPSNAESQRTVKFSGVLDLDRFEVGASEILYVSGDLEVRAKDTIIIHGSLICRDGGSGHDLRAPSIYLKAENGVYITGQVLGGRGGQNTEEDFNGGSGGVGSDITIESVVTVVDGLVRGGDAGIGLDDSKGARGGNVFILGDGVSSYSGDPLRRIVGGTGGYPAGPGGKATVLAPDLSAADYERKVLPTLIYWQFVRGHDELHQTANRPSPGRDHAEHVSLKERSSLTSCGATGEDGPDGNDATGGTGGAGQNGAHGTAMSPQGESGRTGGTGLDGTGGNGTAGVSGESCCHPTPQAGGTGGKGGNSGKGTGGKGGTGGLGGNGWWDGMGYAGPGGTGGVGGAGGTGTSGNAGKGGNGGQEGGGGGAGGSGVDGVKGQGGTGGAGGVGTPNGSQGDTGGVGGNNSPSGANSGDNGGQCQQPN